ncbi:hypothetical protein KDM41_05270 [bacterium]|nr:hypothetical protein [bacterium]
MQDLAAMSSPPAVHILGVNQLGHESANDLVCQGRDLPWLQETLDDQVWNKWKVTYRDVVVLDRNNRPAAVFNLTVHDLARPADYDSLRALLLEVAR